MLNNFFQTPKPDKAAKSNMIFSCGPGSVLKKVIPTSYWREDEYECTYYKLTAPLLLEMQPELAATLGFPVVAQLSKHVVVKVIGPVVFIAHGNSFWGGEKARNFRSKVYENPTYRMLMGAAKSSQKVTRDYHHQFIESAYYKGTEEIDGRKVTVLEMSFGS